jgi:hypothetical protein
MFDAFEEGFPPPEVKPSAPAYLIVSPEPGLPTRVTLLGNRLVRVRKHWDENINRPVPCNGSPEKCRYCAAGLATFDTGFVAAVLTRGRRRVVFQLSAGAILLLRAHKVTVPTLRGQAAISERSDSRRKSKQLLEFWGEDAHPSLPEEFDFRETLSIMWGKADARLASFEELGMKPGRRQHRPRGER